MSSRLLKKFLKEKTKDEIKKINEEEEEEEESSSLKLGERKKKKNAFTYLMSSESDDSVISHNTNGDINNGEEKKNSEHTNSTRKQKGNKKNDTFEKNNTFEKRLDNHFETTQNVEEKKKKKKKKKKNVDDEISDILNEINKEEKKNNKGKNNLNNQICNNHHHHHHHTDDNPVYNKINVLQGEGEKYFMNNALDNDKSKNKCDNKNYSNNNCNNHCIHDNNEEESMELQLSTCTHEKYEYCLKLEKNNFDVNIELKRIFGKSFVKENKYIQKSKIKYLKNWIIQDFTTKIVQPPLSMIYKDNEFKIEKNKLYLDAENLFYLLLDTHDIQAMNELVKKYPFHVDTLLVLAEYYNETRNYEVANKFIKMSILLLQNIFHINFHPNFLNKNFNIFINPYIYDNKCLFKSLYMHMLSLENEACTITSLEIAKLLCKIDLANDLCSILLRIDNIILKCNLYDFLLYFSFNFIIQNIQSVIPPNTYNQIVTSLMNQQNSITPNHIESNLLKNNMDNINNINTEIQEHNINKTNVESNKHDHNISSNNQMSTNQNQSSTQKNKNSYNSNKEQDTHTSNCNENHILKNNLTSSSQHCDIFINEQNKQSIIMNKQNNLYIFNNYELRLHFILPNFAFAIPMSLYLKMNTHLNLDDIKLIKKDDIIHSFSYEECKYLIPHFNIRFICYKSNHQINYTGNQTCQNNIHDTKQNQDNNQNYSLSFCAHLFLIRALLQYPCFLKTFLNYNNFKATKIVKQTIYDYLFQDILAAPPFSNTQQLNREEYEIVQKIVSCFLEKNNIYYKSEKVITWLHVCSSFIHEMYKDKKVSQEIDEVRKEYCQKIALLDINKYKHVRVGEFKSHNYLLPDFLMEKNRSYTPNVTNRASDYYISLNSNLLIAFFQSLLPWYQVDYNGTNSRPVYFSTLLRTTIDNIKHFFNCE
ncbi:hypothetical protein PFBG_00945 [Plasmodium falciparum 7G8]|uniref:Transcription factor 25, putative n=12 Tax=Plasmodium falciparum TaxID=5833 RepID=Q8I434_PLAF7|nr:transcription factor 25, putative [Plasmodium falciparum 3D7]EUR77369.1 hypothetical protein PFBG_00945 [Plasmodium falciparum 7G8]KAF4328441.1 transcription factor 25 [Plasmodium falciparum NF54]CAD51433.1 transcription factor 25, putative [Plasmodium falciparum 3D7]|eukprot:XP_001351626.1 transcription factor 25, putative [Plasmodium falciparum 3D7]